ncbi:hydrogenase maturation protease [Candidatus Mycolicibacterium alkanivorans]|uniref:Hydrogenase maturation protease n=1 Tax=Candidatus Mycolicibacterium alkanivorans TaxID=2954114 RepID=A0ABS9YZJ4_9MYCO|nr:hydrogenase maturation protease [Candidatus Mycolicibacterium alkanivorans]MCI4676681.1 hydrogenase maturation protease [Candidatus Mycolicibacterium alkanivorans]
MTDRILIAGVGNIFLGDDGFGPEVIRRLEDRFGDDTVRVTDYGIGGMHLAYDLLEDWSALILVDALPNRGSPGLLHVFDADHESLGATSALDAHAMDPGTVFASLRALGGIAPRTIVVGCEALDTDDGIDLSQPVRAALPAAVQAVQAAVAILRGRPAAREA